MAYVSADGNFGGDEAVVFEEGQLTDGQWEQLDAMPDGERLNFVRAVLAGQDLSEWDDYAEVID